MARAESALRQRSECGSIVARDRSLPSRHGTRPLRVPGDLFRAMGVLYLRVNRESSRESLARKLQALLEPLGVRYHIRSLKRQLTGIVATVPKNVQNTMCDLLLQETTMKTLGDIEFALWSAGLTVSSDRRRAGYVATTRILPLIELWLMLHPTRSRRALAVVLSRQLAKRGIKINIEPLQVILGGRQTAARREILDELLVLLGEHGIDSELQARKQRRQLARDIANYTADRQLEPANRLMRLALAWKVLACEPSSRRLARILRERVSAHGLDLGVVQIQRALDGKAKHARAALVAEMESLLSDILPAGSDHSRAVADALGDATRLVDLSWVRAKPIAHLAQRWLLAHPDASMRQLAIDVARSAQDMGYRTSHNTIQPVLGGYKQRTRGFIYRAMLKQFSDCMKQVPAEHILPSGVRTRRPLATRLSERQFG